jgi:dihydroflavonol-4-reductase
VHNHPHTLVTGASGFLGSHLVQHLSARGVRVRALYNRTAPGAAELAMPGVEWVQCDLLDVFAVEEAMQGITDVYHCAAMVSFDPKKRAEMLHFNVESTANIVNEALVQEVRRLVHVSSVAALGRTGDGSKEISEDQEWIHSRYNSAYGLSKYLSEMEVWRGIGEGLDAVIANPGIILGSCNDNSAPAKLVRLVQREFPFYTQGITSWVGVEDTVRALELMMHSGVSAERFIISAGNYGYRHIFTVMAEALDKKPPRRKASPIVTGIVWRLSSLRGRLGGGGNIITRETAANANSFSNYDNSKFLSHHPAFTYASIEETVARMARSFIK